MKSLTSLTEHEENWLAGTYCISSGVLTMKDSTSKIPVTKSTGDTRPEKEETWTAQHSNFSFNVPGLLRPICSLFSLCAIFTE